MKIDKNIKYNILNTLGEIFDSEAKGILDSVGNVSYSIPSQEELVNIISQYDIVVIGLGLNFSKDVLESATKLKIIVTATTGTDHIDLKTAEQKGIKVLSLKGEDDFLNTITGTAELSLALTLCLSRNIIDSAKSVAGGEWDRDKFKGHSLYGYTMGIVGLGRLGCWMAKYANSLGMKVIFTDPNVEASSFGKKVSFEELLKVSDFISIHVHLSPETEYMFNKKTLGMMKKTSYLINTSRGKIVQENDLIEALDKKVIMGYGTDVLDGEIYFSKNDCSTHPLVKYSIINPNILILPHIGGMTYESRRSTDIFISQKLQKHVLI